MTGHRPPATVAGLVGDYIALRRGLGYRSPVRERALRAFARYLDEAGHDGPIPLEASLDWAAATTSIDPCNPARRLASVRGFLRHLSALDGRTEVPAAGLLGSTGHRRPPHVYSDGEIAELLAGRRRAGAARRVAAALLRHAVRAAGLHRAADLRGPGTDLRRCRSARRCAHRAGRQTRPDEAGAAAPQRAHTVGGLRRRPGTPLRPTRCRCGVLPHRPQRPDQLHHRQPRLRPAAPAAGLDRGRTHRRATGARSTAPDGGATHPGLARRGRGRRRQDRRAGHLPRTRGSA